MLADLAPDAAPGSLRAAVAAVPAERGRRGPVRGGRCSPLPRLAAAVVLVGRGSIGLVGRAAAGPARDRSPGFGRRADGGAESLACDGDA